MNFKFPKSVLDLDEILAIFGIISSIVLMVYLKLEIGRPVYLFVSILSFISFSIWLFIRKNASLNITPLNVKYLPKILLSLFFAILTIDIISLYLRPDIYQRPIIHFSLVSLMVGILSLEIFTFEQNKKLYNPIILIQITLVGILISWSQLVIFPDVIGVDPWYHQYFTMKILDTNFIPQNELYSKLPLFHILIANTSLVTKLNYKFATMFSVSLVHIICNSLFIFLLTKNMFPDHYKVAYFAPLLLVISNNYIYMNCISIPNSFAAIFLLPIFYSLIFLKAKKPLIASSISIFLSIVLILSHTITALFMSMSLFVFWTGSVMYGYIYLEKKHLVPINFCILFAVCMFGWWSFISGHLNSLVSLFKWGFNVDFFAKTATDISMETLSQISIFEQLFENIGMFLFFSLSFIGCLYMVSQKYGNSLKFSFTLVAITPLFIGFFSLIFDKFTIVQRWWYFSQIMLAIPLSIALILVFNMIMNNSVKYITITSFTILLTFLLITNSIANIDNHTFSPHSIKFSLTSSELKAIETNSHIWNGNIKTDWYYAKSQKYYFNTESFDKELYEENLLVLKGNSLILIRDYIIHNPFQLCNSIKLLNYDLNRRIELLGFSNTYDNGHVEGYV